MMQPGPVAIKWAPPIPFIMLLSSRFCFLSDVGFKPSCLECQGSASSLIGRCHIGHVSPNVQSTESLHFDFVFLPRYQAGGYLPP